MTEADLTPKAPLVREDEHPQFERTMKARHLIMLSLGGVIGTGLFFNTGFVIGQTGAFGTVVAYLIGALVVYLVMLSMGELCVAMPQTGSFHLYATTFIGPAHGLHGRVALLGDLHGERRHVAHGRGARDAVLVPERRRLDMVSLLLPPDSGDERLHDEVLRRG